MTFKNIAKFHQARGEASNIIDFFKQNQSILTEETAKDYLSLLLKLPSDFSKLTKEKTFRYLNTYEGIILGIDEKIFRELNSLIYGDKIPEYDKDLIKLEHIFFTTKVFPLYNTFLELLKFNPKLLDSLYSETELFDIIENIHKLSNRSKKGLELKLHTSILIDTFNESENHLIEKTPANIIEKLELNYFDALGLNKPNKFKNTLNYLRLYFEMKQEISELIEKDYELEITSELNVENKLDEISKKELLDLGIDISSVYRELPILHTSNQVNNYLIGLERLISVNFTEKLIKEFPNYKKQIYCINDLIKLNYEYLKKQFI